MIRQFTIAPAFRDGIEQTDTRDLAAVLAAANPWMHSDVSFWLSMANGLKDYMDDHPPMTTEHPEHQEERG